MSIVAKRSYLVECDTCGAFDESGETGGPWHYDSAEEAGKATGSVGWAVAPDGRLRCPWCVEQGQELPPLRCTCPAGRGTNPGCPVCP